MANDKTSSNGGGSGDAITARINTLRRFVDACAAIPNTEEECFDIDPPAFTALTFGVHEAVTAFILAMRDHGEEIVAEIVAGMDLPPTAMPVSVGHQILGDGVIADFTGEYDHAIPTGQLPDKVPGRHRWMVMAMYVAPEDMAQHPNDDGHMGLLDHESLFALTLGCFDCEAMFPEIEADSECPA